MIGTNVIFTPSKKADMSFGLHNFARIGPGRATCMNQGIKIPNTEVHVPFQPVIR